MRTFAQSALTVSLGVALLSGCGGSQSPISAPGAIPQASPLATRTTSTNYKVLYSFTGSPDGAQPRAGLIDVNGTLYGTTDRGGAYSPRHCFTGCGTVYSINMTGTEQVLHSFGSHSDGGNPVAGLINMNGTLYGTTESGGTYRQGTVFNITTTGTENLLYSFRRAPDGTHPIASLIDVSGTLYGTTHGGGAYKGGTVFSVTSSGTELVLHSFGPAASHDARAPWAGLIEGERRLYGTTSEGGVHGDGTVFSITTIGTEQMLYSFEGSPNGYFPLASLIDVHGRFYGTTYFGGQYGEGKYMGDGTVFSISKSGKEVVLHNFSSGSDGSAPLASLIDVRGTLYGTTSSGGAYGDGTVFSITTGGTEKVLHSFGGSGSDGKEPATGLIDVNGTLYGATSGGGAYGYGTVFALTP